MISQSTLRQSGTLDNAFVAFQAATGLRIAHSPSLTQDSPPEAILQLRHQNQSICLPYQIKAIDRFHSVAQLKAKPGETQALLVAPYVSATMAEHCRELGIPFIDEAGNAFIEAPGLYVFISGKQRVKSGSAKADFRALSPAGLRIVFALLQQVELASASYRQIAQVAGVALGTIGPVLRDLQRRDFLWQHKNGSRMIQQRDKLIDEWVTQLPIRLRPKLQSWRFTAPGRDWWQNCVLTEAEGCWGGEVAAAKLTGLLKPATVLIYTESQPEQLIVKNRLRPDQNGEIEIREKFWHTPNLEQNCVPGLLIFADLMNSDDPRNVETAQLIRERYLA